MMTTFSNTQHRRNETAAVSGTNTTKGNNDITREGRLHEHNWSARLSLIGHLGGKNV